MIKAVIFDVDGTLTDPAGSERTAVKMLYKKLNCSDKVSMEKFIKLWFEEAYKQFDRYLAGEIKGEEHRILRVTSVFEKIGKPITYEDAIDILKLHVKQYNDSWTLYEDVIPVLDHLKEDYKLGIISNGRSHLQHEKLEQLGITDYFSSVIIAEDAGVAKPDPEIYQTCLYNLDVDPSEAIFIGDDILIDIIGAIRARMHSAWINRCKTKGTKLPSSAYNIKSLYELQDLLTELSGNNIPQRILAL